MESCNVCKYKSVDMINGGFLCKIHGPMYQKCLCKEYEFDELKVKAKKCHECSFFKVHETVEKATNSEDKEILLGTCMKYLLRKYNGYTRNSCSQFLDKEQKNIT